MINLSASFAKTILYNFGYTGVRKGFTLIELLVVISIMAVIGTATLASFGGLKNSNAMNQNASQLASFLSDAKSRSLSQLKPASCAGTLDGYVVDFCLSTNTTCLAVDNYVLSMVCSGAKTTLVTKKLPNAVHFSSSGTTSTSYTFPVLTVGAKGSGTTMISGFGTTASVTVSPVGAISIN